MTEFCEENRCNIVVCVIFLHSLCSLMTPFVIYSIGLFASVIFFVLCSISRNRFTCAGFFEVKMQSTPCCSQSSSNQGLIPVIKI